MVRLISFHFHLFTHSATAARIRRCARCAQGTLVDGLLYLSYGRWDAWIQVT